MTNQTPKSRMHYGLKTMASLCRGNTLVPVIIALSISSLAAVAFLKQGADLSEKQKVIQAPYEVLEYLEEWINLKKEKGGSTGKGGTPISPSELSFHGTKNIFDLYMRFEVRTLITNAQRFEYPTKSQSQCELIKAQLKKYPIIDQADTGCANNNKDRLYIYVRYD
ncbi:hypothetical protein N9I89_03370 [Porticoccaceae bacterium]|nr:hypothetical protein [Porticoccaceae bacterium]